MLDYSSKEMNQAWEEGFLAALSDIDNELSHSINDARYDGSADLKQELRYLQGYVDMLVKRHTQ